MVKTLRIALVSPGIPHSSTGPSVSVRELAETLTIRGHEVSVITSDLVTGGGASDGTIEIDSRVNVRLFPERSQFERRLYRCRSMIRWLENHLGDFDIVDIQGIWSFVAVDAAKACLNAHVPYVITPRGQMAHWDWRKRHVRKLCFFSRYLRPIWTKAAAIRYLSRNEADCSHRSTPSRCSIIPNWVNAASIASKRDVIKLLLELKISEKVPIILFLGRMTEQKGVKEILEAFDKLARRLAEPLLLLVGPRDEAYGAMLDRMVGQLPCRERIRMLPAIYGEQRFTLLSIATVFITLSRSEGLPVAVLEALARGTPVVVTEAANLPEVATYGAGRIVSHEALHVSEALVDVIKDGRLRRSMSVQAKTLVAECFSPEIVVPHLERFYRELVSERTCR